MLWLFSPVNSAAVGASSLIITVLGFLLTVFGLRLTFLQVKKARSAADASRDAVESFKSRVKEHNAARDVTEAMYAVEVTRRHLTNDAWKDAADSYEDARRALIRVQLENQCVQEDILDRFKAMLDHMAAFCNAADDAASGKGRLPNKAKVLSTIRENYDILVSMRAGLDGGI